MDGIRVGVTLTAGDSEAETLIEEVSETVREIEEVSDAELVTLDESEYVGEEVGVQVEEAWLMPTLADIDAVSLAVSDDDTPPPELPLKDTDADGDTTAVSLAVSDDDTPPPELLLKDTDADGDTTTVSLAVSDDDTPPPPP